VPSWANARDLQQGKLAMPQTSRQADCVFRLALGTGATKALKVSHCFINEPQGGYQTVVRVGAFE
jgi:hypothetical protein